MAAVQAPQISKDTMLGELMQIDTELVPILMSIGMHCLGCPSSMMETVGEAAMVHGYDPDDLVDEINNYLQQKAEAQAAQQSEGPDPQTADTTQTANT